MFPGSTSVLIEGRVWLRTSIIYGACGCGFAAGCEAGLRPAVEFYLSNGLRPWFGLAPNIMAAPDSAQSDDEVAIGENAFK
jgi:hypothetical protein